MSIFFPKNHLLNSLFLDSGKVVHEMAEFFLHAMEHLDRIDESAEKAGEIEARADRITHDIIRDLQTAFITPYDRDDLLLLATYLDDIVDAMEEIIQTIQTFETKRPVLGAKDFGQCYEKAAQKVETLLGGCFSKKIISLENIQHHIVELHEIEKNGDRIYKEIIRDLFHNETDPIEIFKQHAIITELENAMDQFDQINHVIESIRLKSN